MKEVDAEESGVVDQSGYVSSDPEVTCMTSVPANDIPTQESYLQYKTRVSQVTGGNGHPTKET